MRKQLLSIRRWGVAALAGVTLLGGSLVVGEGVASAATSTSSVTAAIGSTAATTIVPNGKAQATGSIAFTFNGGSTIGDHLTVNLVPAKGCGTGPTVAFTTPANSTTYTSTGGVTWTATGGPISGTCGADTAELFVASGVTTTTTDTLTIGGITVTPTTTALAGAVGTAGTYVNSNTVTLSWTGPTIATVTPVTVEGNVPAVVIGRSATNSPISPITVTEPAPDIVTGYICLAFVHYSPAGTSLLTFGSTAPTVSSSSGSVGNIVTDVGPNGGDVGFQVTSPSTTSGATFTITGLSVDTGSATAVGTQQIVVTYDETAACNGPWIQTTSADGVTTVGGPTITLPGNTGGYFSQNDVGAGITGTDLPAGEFILTVTGATTATITTGTGVAAGTNNVFVISDTLITTIATNAAGFSLQTETQPDQGATGDATVADEFVSAYPVASGGNTNAVISTDADPYDALSVSYLEGILNTGVLITPAGTGTIGPSTLNALKIEGVRNVYIVGGPLAISPDAIKTLQNTPAYYVGGNVAIPGVNLSVNEPAVLGITQDDTAAAIATYEGPSNVQTLNVNAAYGATDAAKGSTTGNGAWNDTIGNETTTAPTSTTLKTAFVINDSDYADALAVAPIAFKLHIPILLTSTAVLSTDVSSAISTLGIQQVIVVGGQLAMPNAIVTAIQALTTPALPVLRVAGQDATDTAVQVAGMEVASQPKGGIAPAGNPINTGTDVLVTHADAYTDGEGAAALSALAGGTTPTTHPSAIWPLLLTENPTTVGTYTTAALNAMGSITGFNGDVAIGTIWALGGTLALPAATISTMQTALAS